MALYAALVSCTRKDQAVLLDRSKARAFSFGEYMHRGFVLLWRKVEDSGWIRNHKLWAFWSWCLIKASYKKRKVVVGLQEIELEPGQFIFGRKSASKATDISERSIRTIVDFLVKSQNLTIKTTSKFSIIYVVNWSFYQQPETQNDQQNDQPPTSHRPTTDQQLTTNNNRYNSKHLKKEKIDKKLFLDFVYLESIEYDKLVIQFGEEGAKERIDRLNVYLGSTGKKYKSHYFTMLNWEKRSGGNGSGISKPKDVFERLKEKYALEEKEWPVEHKPPIL